MAQKPDYYEVLGVDKQASVADIKAAYKKIAMRNHPDMVRNKTDAEKAAAHEKFQIATEAQEVLTDDVKRRTYDQYGHRGLENIKGSTGGKSYTDAAGPIRERKAYTEEDTEDFFRQRSSGGGSSSSTDNGETSEQRRARAAEERRRAREAQRGGSETTPSVTPSVTEPFRDAAEKIAEATTRMKDADLSLQDLQMIRDKAADLVQEVDAAIARSRKNGGPRP